MDIFEGIDRLLMEGIGQGLAYDAIKNRQVVHIEYESPEGDADGPRIIEPYVLGRTSQNNIAIHAFQPHGDTHTAIPGWKVFLLSNIEYWKPTGETFDSDPRSRGYNVEPYNPDGDQKLFFIRIQVQFDSDGDGNTDNLQKTDTPADSARRNLVNREVSAQKAQARKQQNKPVQGTEKDRTTNPTSNMEKSVTAQQNAVSSHASRQARQNPQQTQQNLKQQIDNQQRIQDMQLDRTSQNTQKQINNGKQRRTTNSRTPERQAADGHDNDQGI